MIRRGEDMQVEVREKPFLDNLAEYKRIHASKVGDCA